MRKACDVLKAFKETYEEHRLKLATYFPDGGVSRDWEFAPKLVFACYDKFCERVETVRVRANNKIMVLAFLTYVIRDGRDKSVSKLSQPTRFWYF